MGLHVNESRLKKILIYADVSDIQLAIELSV